MASALLVMIMLRARETIGIMATKRRRMNSRISASCTGIFIGI